MTVNQQYRILNPAGAEPREISEVVNNAMNGKTNNTGYITLNTGWATTTTLYDERIGYDSVIILTPSSTTTLQSSTPYGSFSNNTDQTAPSVGSTAVVLYDVTESSNGTYLDVSHPSRIYVRNTGTYNIQFSLQIVNKDNATQYADVWFRHNGTDVERSNSRFDLSPRKSASDWSYVVGTVNIYLDLVAGDYVEIAGTTSSTLVGLESVPANTGIPEPAIPAAILTLNYISGTSLSNGGVLVTSQQKGQATISHFANNTADKTYKYLVVG